MRSSGRCLLASVVVGVTLAGSAAAGYGEALPERAPGDLVQLGFQLVNLHSRKCLTVTADGLADDAILVQKECRRDAAYRWRFVRAAGTGLYQVINVNSGKCLAIAADSGDDNGFATQYGCADDPARQWRLRAPTGAGLLLSVVPVGDTLIENGRSGKCLTIAGGVAAENAVAVQYGCDDEQSRRWSMRLVAGPAL
ncbi:MAG TPA: RICIN domain-containing protein [Actinoplanes sp.]|nr:RICIN domain-containing protein [Actinoplanes sp.]